MCQRLLGFFGFAALRFKRPLRLGAGRLFFRQFIAQRGKPLVRLRSGGAGITQRAFETADLTVQRIKLLFKPACFLFARQQGRRQLRVQIVLRLARCGQLGQRVLGTLAFRLQFKRHCRKFRIRVGQTFL